MTKGYLSLILHAHLPYIRHPEYESFLEETWLFEAITESYIPLIKVFDQLLAEGIDFRMTVSLSPTLVAMFEDPFLQDRYLAHMARLMRLADQEVQRTRRDRRVHTLAQMYQQLFAETVEIFDTRYGRNLVRAFRKFQRAGCLDIVTSAATHGYLPLLRTQPGAVRAQLLVAADSFRRTFGRPANGIWLPECGYYPGLEEVVKQAGFRHFIVDTHGLLNADARPRYGIFAPIVCPNGVAAFARDPASSKQVWSADEGYPGDDHYREFYRDIGYDLDFDYIRPYILDGRTRTNTGIKYHRITGKTEHKEPYEPTRARERAAQHAADFLSRSLRQIEAHAAGMDRPPLIVCPYDAELFGHWWFEGPQWLDLLIRKIALDQDTIELVTPSQYLQRHPNVQTATPAASSWGDNGYSAFWLNSGNDWIYPHLHHAARQMEELTGVYPAEPRGTLTYRALCLAARSLLLAQASDWAFIMKAGTTVEYARHRVRDHLARFHYLESALRAGQIDERRLQALEMLDNIFPEIDYRVFAHGRCKGNRTPIGACP